MTAASGMLLFSVGLPLVGAAVGTIRAHRAPELRERGTALVWGLAAVVAALGAGAPTEELFGLVIDGLARTVGFLVAGVGLVTLLLRRGPPLQRATRALLDLVAGAGLVSFACADELVSMLVALLAVSVARSASEDGSEGGGRQGWLGPGLVAAGVALVAAGAGATDWATVRDALHSSGVRAGLVLVGAGLAATMGLFPLVLGDERMEGTSLAHSSVAWLAAIAAFALRAAADLSSERLASGLVVVGGIAAGGGMALALAQSNVKRRLAYGTHALGGWLPLAMAAQMRGIEPSAGLLLAICSHAFALGGARALLACFDPPGRGLEAERLGAFAGLGRRHPVLGAALVGFMAMLAGFPPSAGFWGRAGLASDLLRAQLPWASVIVLATAWAGIPLYGRVAVAFHVREHPDPGPRPSLSRTRRGDLGLAVATGWVVALAAATLAGTWEISVGGEPDEPAQGHEVVAAPPALHGEVVQSSDGVPGR